MRAFSCSDLTDFVPQAELLAASKVYDLVYVCKPRLPSLYIGSLIKQGSGCPMIVDVDDFELSFFKNREYARIDEVKALAENALHEPFEELGTRYAQTLVAEADAVTVSNIALRQRFDGHIVRHARDEKSFSSDDARRAAGRARLDIADDEYALVFVGTPRPHKGVGEVARALHELGDSRIVFHVVGELTDAVLKAKLAEYDHARVILHPNCDMNDLPDLLSAADLVPLIQDPDHAISGHQIPAKISDALALGVPVLATRTPPLMDLIAQGAIHATDAQSLAESIRILSAEKGSREATSARARRAFVDELGMSINRVRLNHAIEEAKEKSGLKSGSLCNVWLEMIQLLRAEYMRKRRADKSVPTDFSDAAVS